MCYLNDVKIKAGDGYAGDMEYTDVQANGVAHHNSNAILGRYWWVSVRGVCALQHGELGVVIRAHLRAAIRSVDF